jgi:hypothetical protein
MDIYDRSAALLLEAHEVAPEVVWELLPADNAMTDEDPTVKVYRGSTKLWVFTVISFSAGEGERAYDGTGVRNHDEKSRGAVLHLTRSFSEKLYKLAEGKAPKT